MWGGRNLSPMLAGSNFIALYILDKCNGSKIRRPSRRRTGESYHTSLDQMKFMRWHECVCILSSVVAMVPMTVYRIHHTH